MVAGKDRHGDLITAFQAARGTAGLAVLEGFHAVKHALRFGAPLVKVVTVDPERLRHLARSLAPDVEGPLLQAAEPVPPEVFDRLAPAPPDTGVLALARRPAVDARGLLVTPRQAPLVFLERPAHLGNVGAVIRVAAAAGAAGVVTSGPHDPWHPAAIRGAAGLQYALPVGRLEPPAGGPGDQALEGAPADGPETPSLPDDVLGPVVAVHPEGEPLRPGSIPSDAVLAFGSERRGLSPELLARVDQRIAIPMAPGVSSLNLATAVAVVLYTWRLEGAGAGQAPRPASP